mgnify:FL=1
MRHEKPGQEQHDRTLNDGHGNDWDSASKKGSAEIDTPKTPSLRSKIGDMAMTFAEWIKREDTDEPGGYNDVATSLNRLIKTTLTPEQQQEVKETATKLAEAIVKDEQPVSSDLAEKLTTMRQPVRDCTIKEVLSQAQLEYTKRFDDIFKSEDTPIDRATEFMVSHRLFLENYDGLAETTVSFLKSLAHFAMDVDETPYTYFVNGALNDRQVGQQIKAEIAREKTGSQISDIAQDVIFEHFVSGKRDVKNLVEFAGGFKNIGYDMASSDAFMKKCIEHSSTYEDFPDLNPRHYPISYLQDNLYRAGLINDDNIGRLYYQLAGVDPYIGSHFPNIKYTISLDLCPESEVTKYWRRLQIAGPSGIISPADNNAVTNRDIDFFRQLLVNAGKSQQQPSNFSEYFKEGIPDQSYYDQLANAPILCDDDQAIETVRRLPNMPMTPEILDILGSGQKKVLDIYREWEQKGVLGIFFKSVNASDITTVDELIELSQRSSSFLDKYPLANLVDRESVIDAHIQGKDALLSDEYFSDLVLFDSHADRVLSEMDDEMIEQVRRHLDTLSRFSLFDGDRARMVNYAVLAEEHWEIGQLFDELTDISELDEATRDSLNLVLKTGNPYGIKTIEELENYRAVIAERATNDLVSNDVRDAYRALSFIILSDFNGRNSNYFDLEILRQRHVLTPDDEAVIDLFSKVDPGNFGLEFDEKLGEYVPSSESADNAMYNNGEATEKLLQTIASSPLCVPVEDESGVAKITKIEGSASDLINKLRHYIIDDWNKSLIDLEATGEGIEHLTIDDDEPGKALKVIKLTGAPFKMLSHTIYGRYLRPDVFRALISDPDVWNTAQGSATISTSCIDERHCENYLQIGSDKSSRVLLGFNHIQPGGIVAMAPNDGYLRGGLNLKMSNMQFTTCDELIRKFDQIKHRFGRRYNYNEVGLSRISSEPGARNGRLQPSHIIVHGSSTDDINENSKKFARYFGVPITLIDDEAYYRKYNAKSS